MDAGQDGGDLFANQAEYRERSLAAQRGLCKILRGGIMRRKIRILEAVSPLSFDNTCHAMVENAEGRVDPVQCAWASQSPITEKTYKLRLVDIPTGILDEYSIFIAGIEVT